MKRSPGRPPVDPDRAHAHINLTLPARDYDRVEAIARRQGVSVPEVIRRKLRSDPSSDDE